MNAPVLTAAKWACFAGLLTCCVWVGYSPGPESVGGMVLALAGFLAASHEDSSRREAAIALQVTTAINPDHLAHDRELFRRLEDILPEARMLDELNGNLYNHYTHRDFVGQWEAMLRLAETQEGKFLLPDVQTSFWQYARAVADLNRFVAYKFFVPRGDRDASRRMLYPDLRDADGEERRARYDKAVADLTAVCERVDRTLRDYRATVRNILAV